MPAGSRVGLASPVPSWALVGSAVLHVAALTLPGLWAIDPSDVVGGAGEARRTVVRWISEGPGAVTAGSSAVMVPGSTPDPASADSSSLGGNGHAVVQDMPQSPAPATGLVVKDEAPPEAATATGAPAVGTAAPVAPADAVDGYLPRKALSVPPAPRGHIALEWPAGMAVLGRQAAVFTVFIDETGVVRRMVPDGPTLQPTLEAVARDTFTAAVFSPGEVDGRPVKAMIRIEVVFDADVPVATAPRSPSPAVVSRQNL